MHFSERREFGLDQQNTKYIVSLFCHQSPGTSSQNLTLWYRMRGCRGCFVAHKAILWRKFDTIWYNISNSVWQWKIVMGRGLYTVKLVCNDHFYNTIYYLWFIQQCVLMKTEGTNLFLLTISAFWSSSMWPLATKMSSRRQRSIPSGGRCRQVSLYCVRPMVKWLHQRIKPVARGNWLFADMVNRCWPITHFAHCRDVQFRAQGRLVGWVLY